MEMLGYLPLLTSPYAFGFEIPLHHPALEADMAVCIPRFGADILSGEFPGAPDFPVLQQSEPCKRLQKFCKLWMDPSSKLFKSVENVWLECNVRNPHKPADLFPFIKISEQPFTGLWLPDALELLSGIKIPAVVIKNMFRVLSKLPSGASPFQAGIFSNDGKTVIRLCIEGLSIKALRDFIIKIGISTSIPSDSGLLKMMNRLNLHIDVGLEIGQNVGIELRQKEGEELSLDTQGEWDPVLDFLEREGFCLPGNTRFLKEFRGMSYEMLYPDLSQYITFRFLYYLKAVYFPKKPVKVKAYFGFANRSIVPPYIAELPENPLIRGKVTDDSLQVSIRNAALFLSQSQLPHGEFNTYISREIKMETASFDSSPFVTSLLLYSTRNLSDQAFGAARRKAVFFLLKEGIPDYLWKYWPELGRKNIKHDLDDTCCVSFVLEKLFGYADVRKNIPAVLSNRNSSGLFKTWINRNSEYNDIDLVVNVNVLLYLGEREETKEAVDYIKSCLKDSIEKEHYYYYLDNLACYYMVSRAAVNGIDSFRDLLPIMSERILSSRNSRGVWENELATALAVCTLFYCGLAGKERETAALWLINSQNANGSWRRAPFYAGPKPPEPHTVWFGSEELTTAFCIEALSGCCSSGKNSTP